MNIAVYEKLKETAQKRELVTYKDLGLIADLDVDHLADHDELTRLLEEIATHEIADGRPLLVVLVIREDINMPAKGLFKWAKQHGVQPRGSDDLEFFMAELNRVYDAWRPD